MYCLKGGDNGASYEANKTILLESFGEDNCSVSSASVSCRASGLLAIAYADGSVTADVGFGLCHVSVDGYAYCDEL